MTRKNFTSPMERARLVCADFQRHPIMKLRNAAMFLADNSRDASERTWAMALMNVIDRRPREGSTPRHVLFLIIAASLFVGVCAGALIGP